MRLVLVGFLQVLIALMGIALEVYLKRIGEILSILSL